HRRADGPRSAGELGPSRRLWTALGLRAAASTRVRAALGLRAGPEGGPRASARRTRELPRAVTRPSRHRRSARSRVRVRREGLAGLHPRPDGLPDARVPALREPLPQELAVERVEDRLEVLE